MSCIDDLDISIRLQALDLTSGMMDADSLVSIVNRLMRQLRKTPPLGNEKLQGQLDEPVHAIEPAADLEGEDPEERLHLSKSSPVEHTPMPDEYRTTVIHQILSMCSRDTYANINDFSWYVNLLVDLVDLVPFGNGATTAAADHDENYNAKGDDTSAAIGAELRNVAVRVYSVRRNAVQAANLLLKIYRGQASTPNSSTNNQIVLAYAAWIVGEYAEILLDPPETLNCLLLPAAQFVRAETISSYIQAMPKVLSILSTSFVQPLWSRERQSSVALHMARVVDFLEPLTSHPSLEVQERAVEFSELMRLAAEAVANHDPNDLAGPILLTQVIPSLFSSQELNPVAATAQRKVPVPEELDLSTPLNDRLPDLLRQADQGFCSDAEADEIAAFYHQRPKHSTCQVPAADLLPIPLQDSSYQGYNGSTTDHDVVARNRAERRERNRDDPFYIAYTDYTSSEITTPTNEIFRSIDGQDLDIESIPIMNLELEEPLGGSPILDPAIHRLTTNRRSKIHVVADENIDVQESDLERNMKTAGRAQKLPSLLSKQEKRKKALLEVDSSGIGNFSLNVDSDTIMAGPVASSSIDTEDAEMAAALAEVERLRMEMQRASERIKPTTDIPADGTLVKKKKKKKPPKTVATISETDHNSATRETLLTSAGNEETIVVSKKKRKKKKITTEDASGVN